MRVPAAGENILPRRGAGALGIEVAAGNYRRDDRITRGASPFGIDPELVLAVGAAANLNSAVAEFRLDVILPKRPGLNDVAISVDYAGHWTLL